MEQMRITVEVQEEARGADLVSSSEGEGACVADCSECDRKQRRIRKSRGGSRGGMN